MSLIGFLLTPRYFSPFCLSSLYLLFTTTAIFSYYHHIFLLADFSIIFIYTNNIFFKSVLRLFGNRIISHRYYCYSFLLQYFFHSFFFLLLFLIYVFWVVAFFIYLLTILYSCVPESKCIFPFSILVSFYRILLYLSHHFIILLFKSLLKFFISLIKVISPIFRITKNIRLELKWNNFLEQEKKETAHKMSENGEKIKKLC